MALDQLSSLRRQNTLRGALEAIKGVNPPAGAAEKASTEESLVLGAGAGLPQREGWDNGKPPDPSVSSGELIRLLKVFVPDLSIASSVRDTEESPLKVLPIASTGVAWLPAVREYKPEA